MPRVEQGGVSVAFERRGALALLAYLVLAERPQARDSLAAVFWPELDQVQARHALRRTLSVLNHAIGAGWLVAEHDLVELRVDPPL
jgi:DNA-binding SARP family transcriptional activator